MTEFLQLIGSGFTKYIALLQSISTPWGFTMWDLTITGLVLAVFFVIIGWEA